MILFDVIISSKAVYSESGRNNLTSHTFLSRRDKDREFSIGGRAILAPNSKKHKRFDRDISMQEINASEVREMSNKMFMTIEEGHQDSDDGSRDSNEDARDSGVEDGSFMFKTPKAMSKTSLAEPDFMKEVRREPISKS